MYASINVFYSLFVQLFAASKHFSLKYYYYYT